MVYVINYDGKPLMPCTPVIARLLLKDGKVTSVLGSKIKFSIIEAV